MNKPAWIAWDELTRKGECIRCGTALFANEDESADRALDRHVSAHEGCAMDEADRRRATADRNDIRARLERLRLVDSSEGVALRTPIDAGTMAALVTDERLSQSNDPNTRAAMGRVLVALSDLHAAAKRSGWTPHTGFSRAPVRADGAPIVAPKYAPKSVWSDKWHDCPKIVRSAWQETMGFIELKLPEKVEGDGRMANVDVMISGDRIALTIHKHPTPKIEIVQPSLNDIVEAANGALAASSRLFAISPDRLRESIREDVAPVPVPQSVDEYIRLQEFMAKQDAHRLELRQAEMNIQIKAKRAELELASPSKRARLALTSGNAHVFRNNGRIELSPIRTEEMPYRIVDVSLPGVGDDHLVGIRVGDWRAYEGPYGTLRKHGASLFTKHSVRVHYGIPIFIDLNPRNAFTDVEFDVRNESVACGFSIVLEESMTREELDAKMEEEQRFASMFTPRREHPPKQSVALDQPVTEGTYRGGFSDRHVHDYDTCPCGDRTIPQRGALNGRMGTSHVCASCGTVAGFVAETQ